MNWFSETFRVSSRTKGYLRKVTFAYLAAACQKRGLKLYKFRPKYHLGIHLCEQIRGPITLNPASNLSLTSGRVLKLQAWPRGAMRTT